jgi:hypothetical protein
MQMSSAARDCRVMAGQATNGLKVLNRCPQLQDIRLELNPGFRLSEQSLAQSAALASLCGSRIPRLFFKRQIATRLWWLPVKSRTDPRRLVNVAEPASNTVQQMPNNYANAQWRWNDIPDYERLDKETIEARLRDLLGNWKFYVEVSGKYTTSAAGTADLPVHAAEIKYLEILGAP